MKLCVDIVDHDLLQTPWCCSAVMQYFFVYEDSVGLTRISGSLQAIMLGFSLFRCSGGSGQDGMEPAVPG